MATAASSADDDGSQLWLDQLDQALGDGADNANIVSYKWLSKTVQVPSNLAKRMLHHYKETHQDAVKPVYLIGGLMADDAGQVQHKFQLIPETAIESAKQSFNELTTLHIYSLQKTLPKDTTSALQNLDTALYKQDLQDCNKWSAVKCAAAKPPQSEYVREDESVLGVDIHSAHDSASRVLNNKPPPEPKGKKIDAKTFFQSNAQKKKKLKRSSSDTSKTPALPVTKSISTPDTSKNEGATAASVVKEVKKPKLKRKVIEDSDDESEESAVASASVKTSKTDEDSQATKSKKSPEEDKPETLTDNHKTPSKAGSDSPKKKRKTKDTKPVAAEKNKDKAEPTSPVKSKQKEDPTQLKLAVSPIKQRTRKVIEKVDRTYLNDKGYMVTETIEQVKEVPITEEELKEIERKKNAVKKPSLMSKASAGKKSGSKTSKKQSSMMSFFSKK